MSTEGADFRNIIISQYNQEGTSSTKVGRVAGIVGKYAEAEQKETIPERLGLEALEILRTQGVSVEQREDLAERIRANSEPGFYEKAQNIFLKEKVKEAIKKGTNTDKFLENFNSKKMKVFQETLLEMYNDPEYQKNARIQRNHKAFNTAVNIASSQASEQNMAKINAQLASQSAASKAPMGAAAAQEQKAVQSQPPPQKAAPQVKTEQATPKAPAAAASAPVLSSQIDTSVAAEKLKDIATAWTSNLDVSISGKDLKIWLPTNFKEREGGLLQNRIGGIAEDPVIQNQYRNGKEYIGTITVKAENIAKFKKSIGMQ